MTKFITTLLFLTTSIFFNARAYEVSTDIQKKNILLEVFTGIHCGNCPDGDRVANNLYQAREGKLFILDVHSGHYAIPAAGEPDYRIAAGEALDLQFAANDFGYPSGMLNRKAVTFSGEPFAQPVVLSRASWTKAARTIASEDAPVNLWIKADFDGSSRKLTIDVEGYYTGAVETNENFLNVVLTQDDIIGFQSGASNSSEYNHRHMFKATITPLWGDTIVNPAINTFFTRHYEYILPTDVNNIPLKAEDVEVVAFVTADKDDVLNVESVKPTYTNYSKPLNISIDHSKQGIAQRYAFNFFDIVLKNESHLELTTVDFDVEINGAVQNIVWEGEIPSFQEKEIRIPVEEYPLLEDNTYEIKATSANGNTVNTTALSGTFTQPLESTPTVISEIKTDIFSDDNTVVIKDRNGNTVKEFGPFVNGQIKTYKDTTSLETGKIYCLEITDRWGDGIPNGSLKLRKNDGALFAQNIDIKTFGYREFFKTSLPDVTAFISPKTGTTNAFIDAEKNIVITSDQQFGNNPVAVYSITGQCVVNQHPYGEGNVVAIPAAHLPSGVYIVVTGNYRNKIIIKQY